MAAPNAVLASYPGRKIPRSGANGKPQDGQRAGLPHFIILPHGDPSCLEPTRALTRLFWEDVEGV